jgi:GT2 family glycosyltransferase
VPTIGKFDGLKKQLSQISKCQSVGEIIIINNNKTYNLKIDDFKDCFDGFDRVIVFNSLKELYCNGAWNAGMFLSDKRFQYAILATEDLEYDAKVIDLVAEQIDAIPKLGILGMDWTIMTEGDLPELNYIYIDEGPTQREYGFGLMMFLNKSNWVQIPDGIRHWYGDDFLYYTMLEKDLTNYLIKSDTFRIKTVAGSMSTSETTLNRIAEDKKFWMNNYYQIFSVYGTRCG